MNDRLDAALGRFMTENRLPGASAAVVGGGEIIWSAGWGFADRASGRRPDDRTLYRIASISKTFTATAIMQLRDEGALRLDDPVVRHVPEAAAIVNPFGPVEDITIRRLLLHTSGLQGEYPTADPDQEPFGSIAELVANIARLRVVIAPDTLSKYCNVGFQLLGAVVERAAGEPFAARVARTILDPLGMASTVYLAEGPLAARCAVGYDARAFSDALAPAKDLDSRTFEADGGLWSCVEDLARWLGFQLGDEHPDVLAPATRREQHRPWIIDEHWEEAQGLCWYWERRGDDRFVGHAGSVEGFTSRIAFSPADGVGAVVLVNGIGEPTTLALELTQIAALAERARPVPSPVEPPTSAPAAVADLLGLYGESSFGEQVRIEWHGAGLVLVDSDGVAHRLVATGDPLCWTIEGGRPSGESILFLRGPDGAVNRSNTNGYPMRRLQIGI